MEPSISHGYQSLLWKVADTLTTALPAILLLPTSPKTEGNFLVIIMLIMYFLVRLYLIVEVFVASNPCRINVVRWYWCILESASYRGS